MLINKELSTSHARVLSKLNNESQIIELANKIKKDNLNVRDIEKIVNNVEVLKRNPVKREEKEPKFHIYENIISDKIGNKVKIKNNKIEISFNTMKDLERIMEIFNISIEDD